jgi:uncharacterized protein YndB with AHSA1/START domain
MQTIAIQSFVAAPPRRVWDALLGRPEVVLDALPVAAWPEDREEQVPSRLRAPWPFPGAAAPTTVEIALVDLGERTRVDLRHEGWDDGPASQDAIAGHFAGWLQALAALGLLVETGRDARASSGAVGGRERYFASAEIGAGSDAVYRALTDPAVRARWSGGALDGAMLTEGVEGQCARWNLAASDAAPRELVIVLRRTPRGTHCALAEYGVSDRSASGRWPGMFERLSQFLR